jgi:tetratricopeptide (TPR) repeat protein
MEKNNDGDKKSSVKKHIGKYKSMLKSKHRYYFDVEEFEDIIEYFISKEKPLEAENAIKYALNLHPGAFNLLMKQAQIYVETERPDEAMKLLMKLKAIQPEAPEVYFWIGIVEMSKNNINNADENFMKLLEVMKDEDEDILLLAAFSFIQHGEYKRAIHYLKRAFNISPKNKYALYDLAYCYEQIKDYHNASLYYRKYLEENPYEASVWYNFGVINSMLQEYETAIDAYDFAIAIDPKLNSALYNKAVIYSNLSRFDEAISTFIEFLETEKNSIDGNNGLGDCYRKIEEYENAEKAYLKVLEIDKNNIDALYGISAVCALSDQNLEGLNYVIRALRIEKRNPEFFYLAAKIFLRLGYNQKSEEHFIKALEIDPFKVKYWKSFSELFVETEPEKSISIIKEALKVIPENADLYYLLAEYLFNFNKQEHANKFLAKAKNLDPDYLNEFFENCPEALKVSNLV